MENKAESRKRKVGGVRDAMLPFGLFGLVLNGFSSAHGTAVELIRGRADRRRCLDFCPVRVPRRSTAQPSDERTRRDAEFVGERDFDRPSDAGDRRADRHRYDRAADWEEAISGNYISAGRRGRPAAAERNGGNEEGYGCGNGDTPGAAALTSTDKSVCATSVLPVETRRN